VSAQLWAKGLPLDQAIHRFTVGDDPESDVRLLVHDALGSVAHARMLAQAGLMSQADAAALVKALAGIARRARQGGLQITLAQEDAHTAIEALLTAELGDAGRRIHLGRSRNDQVILALRLYMREALLDTAERTAKLARNFASFARAHAHEPMPGYTHLRRAMPSSFGLWATAFAAGLAEELQNLQALYVRLDRCPLGAAAGFGVPLPIEREVTAKLLGFSQVQVSPVDVQNSRGRHELALLNAFASIGLVMEKFLWDVSLYSMQEFGFLKLPDAFTTGSSIMPQKRNPDVVELARGRCRELRGYAAMMQELASGLPSNYHRDLQLLKKPLFGAVQSAQGWLDVLIVLVPALEVDAAKAKAACSDDIYAAHQAFVLAQGGMPFRDAYRQVAKQLESGDFKPDREILTATHLGGAANLGLELIESELAAAERWSGDTRARLAAAEKELWNSDIGGKTK
jgi:argininosuccinate lyase